MPNIKSAQKRVLINEKKNLQNRAILSKMKTAIKKFNAAIDSNNIEEAEMLLPQTIALIDSNASKGVIHKNNAANKKSKLSKRLSDVKSGKSVVVIKKDNKTIAAEKARAAQEARDVLKAENQRKKQEALAAKEKAEKEKLEAEKAAKKTKAKKEPKEKEPKEEKSPAEDKPAAKKPVAKKKATTDKKEEE